MHEKKNFAAVVYGTNDLRLEECEIPDIGDDQVLVEMQCCGICGTDITMIKTDCSQHIPYPFVLGHESSGIVIKTGKKVTHLKNGDRVALELGLPCRKCDLCKAGKYNLCKPWSAGGFQRFHVYEADFCHKLPDNVTLEEGALIEPLACGVRAAKRAGVTLGSDVLDCGADINPWRLSLATKLGATHTVLVKAMTGREIAGAVVAELGSKPEYSIECSGVESSLQAAIYATKSGGAMAPVALDPPDVKLPIIDAAVREVDIRPVFSYCNDYPAAIAMLSTKRVDATPMITHRYGLSDLTNALELMQSRAEGVLKVMILCQK